MTDRKQLTVFFDREPRVIFGFSFAVIVHRFDFEVYFEKALSTDLAQFQTDLPSQDCWVRATGFGVTKAEQKVFVTAGQYQATLTIALEPEMITPSTGTIFPSTAFTIR